MVNKESSLPGLMATKTFLVSLLATFILIDIFIIKVIDSSS